MRIILFSLLIIFLSPKLKAQNLMIKDVFEIIGHDPNSAEKDFKKMSAFVNTRFDQLITMTRSRIGDEFPIELHFKNNQLHFVYWKESLKEIHLFFDNILLAGLRDSTLINHRYIVYKLPNSNKKLVVYNFANKSSDILLAAGEFSDSEMNSLFNFLDVKLLNINSGMNFHFVNEDSPIQEKIFIGGHKIFVEEYFSILKDKDKLFKFKQGLPIYALFDVSTSGLPEKRHFDLHTWLVGDMFIDKLTKRFKKVQSWINQPYSYFSNDPRDVYVVELNTEN